MPKCQVQELVCPVCGCPESNPDVPGTVNIRGFKVCDNYGWWSECLKDHGVMAINGKDVKVGTIWFKLADDDQPTLVSIQGHPLLIWEGEHEASDKAAIAEGRSPRR